MAGQVIAGAIVELCGNALTFRAFLLCRMILLLNDEKTHHAHTAR